MTNKTELKKVPTKTEMTAIRFLKLLKSGKYLPDNLSVGGYLDLRGTSVTTLPDNLSVGGSLYLEGSSVTTIVWMATKCGNSNRKGAVFFYKGEPQIQLGCFRGNEEEALAAIENKYGKDDNYYITVKNAFDEFNEKFTRK